MKLQSLQSSFSAFFKAAIAGCFAGARALQRMAGFRSRTACSCHTPSEADFQQGERHCSGLGPGEARADPSSPPALGSSPNPKGWEEKGFCVHGISVLEREGGMAG